ncbi:SulP family inorganic anion transporter [Mucisphaera sp.]|uniref:SulP family inorganic anion transporter n=1 Tax=Mucisphaera sp. TaxID=2913024 RepID=UPI003D1436B2
MRQKSTSRLLQPVIDIADAWRTLPQRVTPRSLMADSQAALTVALVAIPQSMAFAQIAGLPPVHGLYAGIVGAIAGALLTSSSRLSIGPTNTMSLLTAGVVATTPGTIEQKLAAVVIVTLMAGLFQAVAGLIRLGSLTRFVSHSVVVGFTSGAGLLIAAGQLPKFLGVELAEVEGHWSGLPRLAIAWYHGPGGINALNLMVGAASLVITLIGLRISKYLPSYLIAVIAGAVAVAAFGWQPTDLALVGDLPQGLPMPAWPADFTGWHLLVYPALALALVGLLEAVAIGRGLAHRGGDRFQPDQEALAQGATNITSGLFAGIPCSGSFSRSALADAAGAQTRLACLFTGLLVAAGFVALAPLARYIPLASIAAILIVIGIKLIDVAYFKRLLRGNRADLIAASCTFAATLLLSLEHAVFIGVAISLALYLSQVRLLRVTEFITETHDRGQFREEELEAGANRQIRLIHVEGTLFFAAVEELEAVLDQLLEDEPRVIILRLKRAHLVDASTMHTLDRVATKMQAAGVTLMLCGVRPRMFQRMTDFGLTRHIGRENIFVSGDYPMSSTRQAMSQAEVRISTARADDYSI